MNVPEREPGLGLFVGIGVDEYDSEHLETLDHAVSDVRGFRELLGATYSGEPLENPDENAARDHFKSLSRSRLAGKVVYDTVGFWR